MKLGCLQIQRGALCGSGFTAKSPEPIPDQEIRRASFRLVPRALSAFPVRGFALTEARVQTPEGGLHARVIDALRAALGDQRPLCLAVSPRTRSARGDFGSLAKSPEPRSQQP
jgi:hypothetical protein